MPPRNALQRYIVAGACFTLLGPFLFWILYPIGAIIAYLCTECTVHLIRFTCYHYYVYPSSRPLSKSFQLYLVAILPVSILGFLYVKVLSGYLSRETLVLSGLFAGIAMGFLWSRWLYNSNKQNHW